jgi:ABC-type multidrug transport system fused ATPase/permease subunit
MIGTYRKVLTLFNEKERRGFYLLMCLMVLVALAEVVGISSVLVFLNVLSDTDQIANSRIFGGAYNFFGFTDTYSFLIAVSVVVFIAVLASLAVKAFGAYVIMKFATMRGYALSCKLLNTYLHQPYAWFVQQNSADIAKNVLGEVDNLVARVIMPLLKLINGTISALAVIVFLMVVDPYVSILSAVLLGGIYASLYLKLRQLFGQIGVEMLKTNQQRYRIVGEATGGFKQVKLSGLEEVYTARFEKPARMRSHYFVVNQILGELPRFALEALTFGLLLLLIFVLLIRNDGNLAAIIPTLGIFAFAVIRLLPAVQQIYFSLVSVRSGEELLNQVIAALAAPMPVNVANILTGPKVAPAGPTLALTQDMALSGISFSYEQAGRQALNNLDLHIPAGSKVGIVGGTGAGKTTLIDIILGLLPVQTGTMKIDGTIIDEDNRRAWQNTIGYVPQDIFLTDDTIARNIAFGVSDDQIDIAAVEKAARIAALHDFVMAELPQGYQTVVGERGIRMSGGQRQRIGIARALYSDPSLLIMDEATSALDNITERIVMEAVHNIRSEKTVILIAHRLSTVKECDRIFLMENGRISASGTFGELVSNSTTFRQMAEGT